MQPALMSRGPHPRTRVLCSIHGPDSIWATSWPEAILVHCWTFLSSEEQLYFILILFCCGIFHFPALLAFSFLSSSLLLEIQAEKTKQIDSFSIWVYWVFSILYSNPLMSLHYGMHYLNILVFENSVPGFMKLVFSSVLCFFCFFFYLQVFLCSGVSSVSLSLSPS